MSRPGVKSFPVDRRWHCCVYTPTDYNSSGYNEVPDDAGSVLGTTYFYRMGILVTGTAGNTFEFESIAHFESVPNTSVNVPNTTRSHSDVDGFSMVKDYFGGLVDGFVGDAAVNGFLSFARKEAMNYIQAQVGIPLRLEM